MSEHLIEISDVGLRISDKSTLLAESPGFVSIAEHGPLFGEEARSRARLHPRESFNQYWFQPNLEPLNSSNAFFRHRADMAFAHLQDLTTKTSDGKRTIIAIPSHYNRDQLSLLLGLVQHCPFELTGLVDLGLLALTNAQTRGPGVYLDLQLHQSVLTHSRFEHGELVRHKIQQIPGTGLLALHDAWANMITDAFIEQCRFNPLHTGVTEQYIYDHLNQWMHKALQDNEVAIELNNKGSLYQATIHRSDFEKRSLILFSRIKQELAAASSGNEEPQLVLSDSVALLPGAAQCFVEHFTIANSTIAKTGLELAEHITEKSQGNIFLTRLPSSSSGSYGFPDAANTPDKQTQGSTTDLDSISLDSATLDSATLEEGPTNRHLLIGHRSFSLPSSGVVQPGKNLASDIEMPGTFSLRCGKELVIDSCHDDLLINDSSAKRGQVIHIGDSISFANNPLSIQVIEVG